MNVASSSHSGVTIENGSIGTQATGIMLVGDRHDTVRNIAGFGESDAAVTLTGGSYNRVLDSQLGNDIGTTDLIVSGEHGDVIQGNALSQPTSLPALKVDHSDGNAIVDNAMEGTLLIDGNNNQADFNRVTHSNADGMDVAGVGNVIWGNVADANGTQYGPLSDGINVQTAGNELAANVADDNTGYGIQAAPGVINGGGNQASANGNPAQCLDIACWGRSAPRPRRQD